MREDDDEDVRREAMDERRARRAGRCVCDPSGRTMPGTCPGPDRCPYSGRGDEDESDDDGA